MWALVRSVQSRLVPLRWTRRWKFYRILSAQGNRVRRGARNGEKYRVDKGRQGEREGMTRRGGAGDSPSPVPVPVPVPVPMKNY